MLCVQGFKQDGWNDDAGQVGKHLLSTVAQSRQHIKNIERKLSDAKASLEGDPSDSKKAHLTKVDEELKSAKSTQKEAEKTVKEFMKHQTGIESKMKSKTKASHAEVKGQIKKLISSYCANDKYAKLCSFYKNLETKHAADKPKR